jgi:hypothetical protein
VQEPQGEEGHINSPMVGWVQRLATRGSMVSAHLIRALALRLKLNRTCPITPLHIAGEENSMTDIPSRSFGSKLKWHCRSNTHLLTLFNNHFPICSQNSWTIFQVSYTDGMRVTSVLQMTDFTLDEWRRHQRSGNMLDPLVSLCHTYGSGPFPTGHPTHYQSPPPHRFCRRCQNRLLRSKKTDSSWKRL